jgi:ADP-ribose pyrophosphatase YjhB (NUDIX family)
MLGRSDEGLASQITSTQFDIRVEEHLATIDAIKREIASMTGYSVSHLGLKDEGGMRTATEVTADYTDSERTRDKKAMYVKPALARLAVVALKIDKVIFPSFGADPGNDIPDVEFAAVSQVDPEKQARSIQMLDMARAAATKTRVQMAHPDWEADEVDAEVALILAEQGTPAPDPATFKGDEQPTTPDDEEPTE